jgi:hypothetical protein
MPGDDLDSLFDSIAAEQSAPAEAEPRMRRARRTVLDTVQVEGSPEGDGVTTTRGGGRVVLGDEVDANAPLEKAPAVSYDEAGTDERARADAASASAAARMRHESMGTGDPMERTRRVEAARDAASVSPWWDTLQLVNPLSGEEGMAAGRRTRERASQWWDQFTSGDERLGGRNPIEPIVGRDLRGEAPIAGLANAGPGLFDELAGAAQATLSPTQAPLDTYRGTRDAFRQRSRDVREQAPHQFATGELLGSTASAAAPGLQGIRGAAVMGGVSGFGASEGDLLDSPGRVALDTGTGAAIGTAFGAAGAGLGRAARALRPEAWDEAATATLRAADQPRLEASGVWGRQALEAADRMPGGVPALADDLRRLRVGEGRMGIPRMDRAAADAERIGEAAVERAGDVSRDLTARGVDVPASRILDRADELAAGSRALPSDVAQRAAGRIESEVAPMRGTEAIPFDDAWRLRRGYDRRASFGDRTPSDEVAGEAGGMFRQLRDVTADELEAAAMRGDRGADWMRAMRESSIGRFMEQHGRGAQRLSTQGGMSGATATGDIIADAVSSGSVGQMVTALPRSLAARWLGQEQRMLAPGIRARAGEAAAGGMRTVSQHLYSLANRGLLPPDTPGARQLVDAAARGSAAFETTLHVLAQRDAELRQAMQEFETLQREQQVNR